MGCTLEFLHMNNWLNNYFELLLTSQKLLKNELDMMCVLYGLSTLFRFNNGQLPNEILTKGDKLMKLMTKLTNDIVEMREEDEEEGEDDDDIDEAQEQAEIEKTLNKLENFNGAKEGNDDFEDADLFSDFGDDAHAAYYSSPLEEGDEVVYFEETLKTLNSNNPTLYAELIACLSNKEKQGLEENFKVAREDYEEYQKNKDKSD